MTDQQKLTIRDRMPASLWEVLCNEAVFLKGPCIHQLLDGVPVTVYEVHVLNFGDWSRVRDALFSIPKCFVSSSYKTVSATDYHLLTGQPVFVAWTAGSGSDGMICAGSEIAALHATREVVYEFIEGIERLYHAGNVPPDLNVAYHKALEIPKP